MIDVLASTFAPAASGAFVYPNDRARTNRLVDYDLGPEFVVLPGDVMQVKVPALRPYVWTMAYFDGAFQLRRDGQTQWRVARTLAGVSEVSFALDEIARPILGYVQGGQCYVAWYNGFNWIDEPCGAGTLGIMLGTTQASTDDTALFDVVAAYLRLGTAYVRSIGTNFTVEQQAFVAPWSSTRVTRMGMTTSGTFAIELDGEESVVSTVLHNILEDKAYAAVGDTVVPMFDVPSRTGIWRSKKYIFDLHPQFSWLRLIGTFTSATARLYGDGEMFFEFTFSEDGQSTRIPARRFRELEIEIESDSRVVSAVLASTSAELRAA